MPVILPLKVAMAQIRCFSVRAWRKNLAVSARSMAYEDE